MKKIALLLFIFASLQVTAQKKSVEFQVKKGKNTITFKGINRSDIDQEVTLYFKSLKGLIGYSEPVKKVIPAGRRIKFLELRFNGKYSYNYSYRTKSKPTEQQKLDWEAKVASHAFKEGSELNKGIVVFSKDGCSRCKLSIDYFIKNEVDFKVINISESRENDQLMWKTIRGNGENLTRVSTPVILVEGKVFHRFKNLKDFLKTLKKRYK